MKKIAFALAAISTLAIVTPTAASAETVVVKRGHHHHHWDNGWHRHRGWDRGHGHKTVIIKRSHGNDY